MKTSDFNFEIPSCLIAQKPPLQRGDSRLFMLNRITGEREHTSVLQLHQILCRDIFLTEDGQKPLLVFNDTKVRKARLLCKSIETGACTEFLLLEKLENGQWKTLVKRSGRRKKGSIYIFTDNRGEEVASAQITDTEGGFCTLKFDKNIDDDFLDRYGHVPLPPYIKRADEQMDTQRYQTIYANISGSAAAPTAGLHFTQEILEDLKKCGIQSAFITLHVGLGTFQPVRSRNIEDHVMHEEEFIITDENASVIEDAVKNKRKIIAVGTTTLRSLESAALEDAESGSFRLKRGLQRTSIFIYPGYNFKAVNALFTNFHTPESTLIMLVSAFAGRDLILESYKEAICKEYRFFSYGDAMLIY
ncbi:MAG: tRNA preQ1(34) S-adenosylmethionine ribosyltransferase-isomerase QueA [Treponema sp.]|nr:tRNA preQ1(34) S-adenosylmethionine ribosyltransferase-isomerase QueA [Treponema sp.]